MAEVVAEAVIELRTDDSKVVAGAKGAGEKAGKEGGKGFSSSFKGAAAGAFAAAGVGFGLDKAVGLFKDAIGGASDLNETVSKTGVVFGGASDAILSFASQGASKLGQTKQEALDAATTFGVFGKAAGLTGPKLASFSTDLVGLSTDLASFHNAAPEEVVNALGSALRGEAEPMRKFGVLMDDASLKAQALAMGLIAPVKNQAAIAQGNLRAKDAQEAYNQAVKENGKNSDEANRAQVNLQVSLGALRKATDGTIGPLTNQQKTLAAQKLIMDQTKDAQGDFQRTSGGLANQQRILASQIKDTTTNVGQVFLPAVLLAVGAVNDLFTGTSPLSPALRVLGSAFKWVGGIVLNVVGFFGQHNSALLALGAVVAGIGAAMITVWTISAVQATISAAKQVASWISVAVTGELAGETQKKTAAQVVAGWVIMAAKATWGAIKQVAAWVWGFITGAAPAMAAFAATVLSVVAGWVLMGLQAMLNAVKIAAAWLVALGPVGLVIAAVVGLIAVFVILWKRSDAFRSFFIGMWAKIKAAAKGAFDWIKSNWPLLLAILLGPIALAALAIIKNWDKIKKGAKALWDYVKRQFAALVGFVQGVPGKIASGLRNMWAGAKTAWLAFGAWERSRIADLLGFIKTIPGKVTGALSGMWHGALHALQGFMDAERRGIENILGLIRGVPGKISAAAGNFLAAGKHIGGAVIDGIRNGLSAAAGFAGDIGQAVKNAVNSAMGLPKPITLGVGKFKASFTVPGFAGGTMFAPGGFAMVGEKGPELVALPKGSAVFPSGTGPAVHAGPTINVHLPTGDPMAAALAVANRLAVL